MSELQIFNSEEFGEIRTVAINEEAWFVGKDVAVILGYSNPRDAISKHVDDEDRCDGGSDSRLHRTRTVSGINQ